MKVIKTIGAFVVISIISGCAYTLKINGGKRYVSEICGGVIISSKGAKGTIFQLDIQPLSSALRIEPNDALEALKAANPDITFFNIHFYLDNSKINSRSIINRNQKAKIRMFADVSRAPMGKLIYLPPGDYLTCDDKSIIVDTLKIH